MTASLWLRLSGLAVFVVVSFPAAAQDWPSRSVKIISPFAPGGSSDTVGRVMADSLGEKFKQQFVLENRGGAGGLIGSAAVAAAAPDGYTFGISSIATHVIAPLTSAKPTYDPVANFTNVAMFGGPPTVIAVHPSLGVKSLKELLALMQKRSEPLPYVSPGPGTLGHLIGEYLADKVKVRVSHVAYKGAGQAMNDLVAGHVPLGSLTWTAALGQMQGKTILPLAVSSAQRMPGFPDVPTLRELGYPDLVVTTWFGFMAPAALPASITQQVNTAIGEAMDDPKVRERLMNAGFELEKMLPSELSAYITSELIKWGPLAKKLITTDGAK